MLPPSSSLTIRLRCSTALPRHFCSARRGKMLRSPRLQTGDRYLPPDSAASLSSDLINSSQHFSLSDGCGGGRPVGGWGFLIENRAGNTDEKPRGKADAGGRDAVACEAHSETDCSLCSGLRLLFPPLPTHTHIHQTLFASTPAPTPSPSSLADVPSCA